ncbi:EamA family transporter [Candidatus Omnitrophota bacterium]
MSNWFLMALGCAFFSATTAVLSKIILRTKSGLFVIWVGFVFSLPIFLIIGLYNPPVTLNAAFWKIVALLLPLELVALFLYMKALKTSPISLIFPFLGLTPVVSILSSAVILKERLHPLGVTGIVVVSLGAYIMNADKIKDGLLAPIKSIFKEKGIMLMIAVALIFGFTVSVGKKAVMMAGPFSFPAIYYSLYVIILTPVALLDIFKNKVTFKKHDFLLFLAVGACFAMAILLHFKAITLTNVSYMVAVKRVSLVFGVIYGWVIFKEKNIGFRFLGAAVMLIGVLILSLAL